LKLFHGRNKAIYLQRNKNQNDMSFHQKHCILKENEANVFEEK
jgi:hypothetical protein